MLLAFRHRLVAAAISLSLLPGQGITEASCADELPAIVQPKITPGAGSESEIWCKVCLPLGLIRETIERIPTQISYGVKPPSVGDNGLREEVDNKDVFSFSNPNQKINELRWYFPNDTFQDPRYGTQYYAARRPFALKFDNTNGSLQLSTEIDFKIAGSGTFLGVGFFADQGFGNQWPRTMQIALNVSMAADENYVIHPVVSVEPRMANDIEFAAFLGAFKVTKAQLEDHAKKAFDSLSKELIKQIGQLPLKESAEKCWRDLHKPIEIEPGLWLKLTPKTLSLSPLFLENDYLCVWVGMNAEASLGNTNQDNAAVPELPKLNITNAELDRKFAVDANIELTSEYMNSEAGKLKGKVIQVGNVGLTFGAVNISLVKDKNSRLQFDLAGLEINVNGTKFTCNATVQSSPAIRSETNRHFIMHEFELVDLKLDPTIGPLAEIVEKSVKNGIQSFLAKNSKFDVTDEINGILLKNSKSNNGTVLTLSEANVTSDGIDVDIANKLMRLRVSVTGKAELRLPQGPRGVFEPPTNVELGEEIGGDAGYAFRVEAQWPNEISGVEVSANGNEAVFGLGVLTCSGLNVDRYGRMEDKILKFTLADDEYLTAVDVKFGGVSIDEITFVTNKNTWGPVGKGNPNLPWLNLRAPKDHKIVGFRGKAGGNNGHLERIGIIVRPLK